MLLLGGIGLVTIAPFMSELNVNTTSSTTDNGVLVTANVLVSIYLKITLHPYYLPHSLE